MSNLSVESLLPPKVVRASAGTGKTFQLSSRYLQLLLFGEQPDKILATTFTKKAAGEIRERILQRLVVGATDSQKARQLGQELDIANLKLEKVVVTLKNFIAFQHRLQIRTLDSFFISLAKSFTAELRLPTSWRILDPSETTTFFDEAVKELCQDSAKLLELLALLQNNQGTRKVHGALVDKVSKLQELIYTSTKESWNCDFQCPEPKAEDLLEAIKQLQNFSVPLNKSGKPNIHFQNGLNKIIDLVNGSGYWEGRSLNEDSKLLQKLIIGEPDSFNKVEIPEELLQLTRPIVQQIRYRVLNRTHQQTVALRVLMESLVQLYEGQRNLANAVSFDDIKRLLQQATISENLTDLYFRIDTKINHILLDEFQDTSLAEWVLLEPIVAEVLAHADGSHSFFCVGDTKQAIYGFRGGVAEIFDQLESRWEQLETERLEVSRRSSQIVLDYVNYIFEKISENTVLARFQQAGSIWQKRFDRHTAFNQELPGYVSFVAVGEESSITLMADQVQSLYLANPTISIGVLVRNHQALAKCLYELKKRSVPASGEGGSFLTDSPVVTTLLSFLWLMDHPADRIAHYHVASSPLAEAFGIARTASLEELDLLGRNFRNKLLNQNLRSVLAELARQLDSLCAARDQTKLQQVVNATITFNQGKTASLTAFVEYVRKLKIPDPEQSPVKVMTIHQSKGLEFDAVFLADLDHEISRFHAKPVMTYKSSIFEAPSRVLVSLPEKVRVIHSELNAPYHEEQVAEAVDALSVLYVALTRARYALYLFTDTQKSSATVGKLLANANQVIASQDSRKKSKGKNADIIEAQLIYSEGDINWNRLISKNNQEVKPEIVISLNPNFAGTQTLGLRNIPRVTPSKTKTKVQFRGHSIEGKKARNKGTLLHRLYESIDWIDTFSAQPERVLKDLLDWSNGQHLCAEEEVHEAVAFFLKNIQEPAIINLLSRASYQQWVNHDLKVERERRFTVVTQKGLSVGTIDRLVLGCLNGQVKYAEIIDFKSDLIPSKHYQFHTEQLESYKEAVSEMYQIPFSQISCKIVYLETLEVKIV